MEEERRKERRRTQKEAEKGKNVCGYEARETRE